MLDFLFGLILVNGPNYLQRLSVKGIEDKIVNRCSEFNFWQVVEKKTLWYILIINILINKNEKYGR